METKSGQQIYQEYVDQVTPKANLGTRMLKAFLVGGLICTIGPVITELLQNVAALEKEDASAYCTLILILTSVILTGFANSVASTAIEYKFEGQVFGIGCKIFTIAGPVILYGILSSWILGFIYWLMGLIGM